MNENMGFRSVIVAFENLRKIGLDMSLYTEIRGDIAYLRIAETMNEYEDSMYVKHMYGEPLKASRVATGDKIIDMFHSEMEKVEIERLKEMYGEEEPEDMSYDEEESDLTQEEVRERAIPRMNEKLATMVGEIIKENKERLTDDHIVVYWNNERITGYKLKKETENTR